MSFKKYLYKDIQRLTIFIFYIFTGFVDATNIRYSVKKLQLVSYVFSLEVLQDHI